MIGYRRRVGLLACSVIGEALAARRTKAAVTTHQLQARLAPARELYRRMRAESGRAEKMALDDLPRPLRWLIQSLLDAIGEWWSDLGAGDMTLGEWFATMRDALAEYHLAAFMAGNGSEDVSDQALDKIADLVNVQLDYLQGFKAELQTKADYQAGAAARAESYAPAIKVPYWTGRTAVLPLPAMPAQGTQCHNNCKCKWDVKTIDAAKGDYDAFWVRHSDDSCQTCLEREAQWNPVLIRDGVLQ